MSDSGRDADKSRARQAAGSRREDKDVEPGEEKKDQRPKGSPVYKRPVFIVIVSFALLLALVASLLYWRHSRQFVSTDDAYIDGHVAQVAPQVAGQVAALHVEDN